MAILDDKLNKLNKKCDTNTEDITDTQIAVTEAYEKTIQTETTVTDLELAIVELYETMTGGAQNG